MWKFSISRYKIADEVIDVHLDTFNRLFIHVSERQKELGDYLLGVKNFKIL